MTPPSPSRTRTATAGPRPPPSAEEDAAIAALLARLPRRVTRVGALEYELGTDWAHGQRVPARFFASRALLELAVDEADAAVGAAGGGCAHAMRLARKTHRRTARPLLLTPAPHHSFISALQQLANVATLPGIIGASVGMPDVHAGYGFAIGNVAAFDLAARDAVVSPGGVGFDINCGVRLLRSALTAADLAKPGVLNRLADALYKAVPAGTGASARALPLYGAALERVLNEGMGYLEAAGLCWPEDRDATEERGCFPGADAAKVSARAKARGTGKAGTLGAGNHYLEVQVVEHVYDEAAAAAMGLRRDGVCVMLHTGSRGLGHQVCTDALQQMDRMGEFKLVDRQARAGGDRRANATCARPRRCLAARMTRCALRAAGMRARGQRRGARLPGSDALRGQLRVCQPQRAGGGRARGVRGRVRRRRAHAAGDAPGV